MFRFSLREVLDYRGGLQEECERELFSAREELRRVQVERQALLSRRGSLAAELSERAAVAPGVGVFQPELLLIYRRYLDELDERVRLKSLEMVERRQAVEGKRLVLVEAMRDVETMEALRKEELRAYEYQERKNEEKLMSDLAIFNFNSRRREKIARR